MRLPWQYLGPGTKVGACPYERASALSSHSATAGRRTALALVAPKIPLGKPAGLP
jgi:hypothetical protein